MESNNPWSFDNILAQGTPQFNGVAIDTLQEIRHYYENELSTLKMQHQQWMVEQQQHNSNQLRLFEHEAQLKFQKMREEYTQQMEEMRRKYDERFDVLIHSHENQLNIIKEQHSQQISTAEASIARLEEEKSTLLQEHSMEKAELKAKIDELQDINKHLEVKNKALIDRIEDLKQTTTIQGDRIEKLKNENFSNPSSNENDRHVQSWNAEGTESSSVASIETAPASMEQWESPSEQDEEHSVYSELTEARYSLARQMALSARANSGQVEQVAARKRSKHPTPPFTGKGARGWLQQFKKLVTYHEYSSKEAIMEFMMAMQGPANDWWMTLTRAQQNNYELAIKAFEDFYGGEENAMARAIHAMKSLKQGKETMQDFGPRLLLLITTITKDNFQLQMSYFHQAVNEEVSRAVIPTKPSTIHEAVQSAIDIERNIGHMGPLTKGTRPLHQIGGYEPMQIDDPMVVDQNYQRSKGKQPSKGYQKKKSCFVCNKDNHLAKDCYYLKKAKAAVPYGNAKKEKRPKEMGTHRSNIQQHTSMPSGSIENHSHNENDPLDITDNIFYKLYNANSQTAINQDIIDDLYIPKEIGGSEESTNFSLSGEIFVEDLGRIIESKLLIDTGAMISTISRDEVNRLHLNPEPAPPIRITYGNSSRELSKEAVRLPCKISDIDYGTTYIRIMEKQNVPIILGMDWLLKTKVLVDPWNKTLVARSAETVGQYRVNTQREACTQMDEKEWHTIPQEIQAVLLLHPTLYNDEEVQTITNAPISHRIDTGDANPIVRKGRRLSPKENEVVDTEVAKLLKKKVIRVSSSPWCCSPPIVIPKPDGTNRFVNNFRALNAITRKDKYPLERMEDLLDKLSGSKWFTVIDLKSAYWQIPIHEEDKCKTAFSTGNALYEYNVLAQGLCNAPPTFARFMNQILRSVTNYTIIYLDDLLCHAKTKEENIRQVTEVLRILHHWNMKISIKKCQWLCTEVRFLGFLVTGTGIRSNPDKTYPIRNYPTPKDLKDLQAFLGICTFYHRFMENLSTLAHPLYKLLRKDTPWKWSSDSEKAFQDLKKRLIALPELAYPDSNLPYDLHCDASDFALGAVLVQNGRPIAYASKTLNPAQKNYTVTEKECMAVQWGLKYFHCYVHGAPSLTVYTDHAALKSILATKDPKGRIARLIVDIWSYEFNIAYRKGMENTDADALSRIQVPEKITQIHTQESSYTSLQEIKEAQAIDPDLKDMIEGKKRISYPFAMRAGMLCYIKFNPPVIVIPKEYQERFLKAIHDHPTSGHAGRDKTLAKAKENGYWKKMNQDIKEYIKKCQKCQVHKTPTHKFKKLQSISVGLPTEVWAADIAFMPESTQGNRYLLVFMDYMTKWLITAALPSFDTNTIANVLLYRIVLVYGSPKKFITDNGSNFISEAMMVVCERLGVKKVNTSVEHPQSDGMVERMNRTLKAALSIYCEQQPNQWDSYLPFVTFSINTTKQATTGRTPYEIMFGRKATLPSVNELSNWNPVNHTTKQWIQYLNHYIPILYDDVKSNIQKSQERQQKYFNKNRKQKEEIKIGDKVLKIKMKEQWKFAEPKFTGPWKVIKTTSQEPNMAFKLEYIGKVTSKRNLPTKYTTANIRDIYKIYQ